jgi:hypothetical protein
MVRDAEVISTIGTTNVSIAMTNSNIGNFFMQDISHTVVSECNSAALSDLPVAAVTPARLSLVLQPSCRESS